MGNKLFRGLMSPNVIAWLKPLIPLRFRGQAMLFLFPMIVIISVIYTFESISTEQRILRNEIIKRGEAVAAIAAKSAELPLLSENLEQLKASAMTLMEIRDIAYVTFLNRKSELLLHAGERHPIETPLNASSDTIQFVEHKKFFEFTVPVATVKAADELSLLEEATAAPAAKEQIGWVCIGLSKAVMIDSQRQIMVRGTMLGIIFSVVGLLLLYLFVTLATRPLYALINAVKEVREGEHPEVPVALPESEVGMLTTEFNRMSRAIKEREDELRSHRDHLEDLVQERTAQLTVAKEQAESASRAKSDFLSSMSHELRTPLNAILGYAQILKLQDNLLPPQRQQVEIMRSSGEHLLMLINDILEVGRIEADKVEVMDIPFDLPALVRQVFDLTRLQAEEKDLRLTYDAEGPLPTYVRGDERKLRQILLNLLSNAVKYTRRGSVAMRVSYDQSGEGIFRCEVADTGIGIPADKLEAIFEPFTQLANGRQSTEGTGLGLNITKRLLSLMHGRISVDSSERRGSTFRIEVPLPVLTTAESRTEPTADRVVGYRGDRKRVLVVDDNIHNTAMIVSLLEPLGFEMATAQSGEQALLLAAEQRPDLILLDLVMPGVDGLNIAQQLRRNPDLEGAVIIGTSATITDSALKDAFSAECDDFIAKPIDLDLLLDKLASHLQTDWETAPATMSTVEERRTEEEFTMPAPPQAAELYELAMLGDMQRIESWAEELKSRNPACSPFAAKLLQLAAKFRTKEILALADQCRGERNGA